MLLALARGLSDAGLLSVFGTLAFRRFVAPRAMACMAAAEAAATGRLLGLVTAASLGVSAFGLLAWLAAQAADMADAATLAQAASALPAVAAGTAFGRIVLMQLAALAATAAALRWRAGAVALAAVTLALQAAHGHAASMVEGPSLLLACDVVHLLAAGAWLGGLLPLLLLVRSASAKAGATAARWFSPMGKLCVAALGVTALWQGRVLVGSVPGLAGTAYGWVVLVKSGLFGVLLAFAWANRYRLAPALLRGRPGAARRALLGSLAVQTGFGLAAIAAATVLSGLPPAMHEQPVWPFPYRFTLDTAGEDPDLLREVVLAGLALALAAALLGLALVRRLRWPALAGAAALAWFAVPHLDLLFVPAMAESFYRSPTGFAASGIVQGAALYPSHCGACHGADGRGDGPAAAALPVPPADLTAAHLWMHEDGELFGWLSHGIEGPEGGLVMPGFAAVLSDDERWDLIDAIRARNAGLTRRGTGAWSPPAQAPAFQARCADGQTRRLADLGGFVRLVIGPAPAASGVTTVLATADPAARPAPGVCVTDDPAVPAAYALVAGLTPGELPGTQFLIDAGGWLRALQPAAAPAWDDPARLSADLGALAAHPLAAAGHGGMRM